MVPGSVDLFTSMPSFSEITGSCHSLPVWHYLRYFSGSKAAFSCEPYLLWKTHFVTMEGRAGTQPRLGHIKSFSDSGMQWAEVCFWPHKGEWLKLVGCGREFTGFTGKLWLWNRATASVFLVHVPLTISCILELSAQLLHSERKSHKQRSSPPRGNDGWGLSRCAL